MKRFRCGDVVPGCTATFHGTEHSVLEQVRAHARRDHALPKLSADLVLAVRGAMTDA